MATGASPSTAASLTREGGPEEGPQALSCASLAQHALLEALATALIEPPLRRGAPAPHELPRGVDQPFLMDVREQGPRSFHRKRAVVAHGARAPLRSCIGWRSMAWAICGVQLGGVDDVREFFYR